MLKTVSIALALTTACASPDKPAANGGDAMPANRKPEATGSASFAESKDGTKLAFEKVGKGPALVIVGGALSQRDGGKPLAAKLSDQFTVYVYDRRGRGESGDTQPYAVEREIEDLGAVIEQAGSSAHVYAVSSGAALALQAAVKLGPTRVSKLAVYEPPYGQEPKEFDEQKERIGELVRTGKPGDAAEYFFTAIGTPPPALEDMKRSPAWEGFKKVDFTLAYDYAVLGNGNIPGTVKQITIPTLVLDGEKTLPFIHPTADRLAQLIPTAQRKTIPGQSHQAAPEVVAPILVEFFNASD